MRVLSFLFPSLVIRGHARIPAVLRSWPLWIFIRDASCRTSPSVSDQYFVGGTRQYVYASFCRSVGFLRVQGGLRKEEDEEEKEKKAKEVKEVATEVAEAQAKESLNYKTTNAGDRPKNVQGRRDFSPRLFLDISILHLFSEFATRFSTNVQNECFYGNFRRWCRANRSTRTGATTDVAWYVIFG